MSRTIRLKRAARSKLRGRGVTAAQPPFKRPGKGSTPFGPMGRNTDFRIEFSV